MRLEVIGLDLGTDQPGSAPAIRGGSIFGRWLARDDADSQLESLAHEIGTGATSDRTDSGSEPRNTPAREEHGDRGKVGLQRSGHKAHDVRLDAFRRKSRHDQQSPDDSCASPILAVVIGGNRRLIFGKTPVLSRADILERGVEAIVGRISSSSGRRRLSTAGPAPAFPAGAVTVFDRPGHPGSTPLAQRRSRAGHPATGRRLSLPVRTFPPLANSVTLTESTGVLDRAEP